MGCADWYGSFCSSKPFMYMYMVSRLKFTFILATLQLFQSINQSINQSGIEICIEPNTSFRAVISFPHILAVGVPLDGAWDRTLLQDFVSGSLQCKIQILDRKRASGMSIFSFWREHRLLRVAISSPRLFIFLHSVKIDWL